MPSQQGPGRDDTRPRTHHFWLRSRPRRGRLTAALAAIAAAGISAAAVAPAYAQVFPVNPTVTVPVEGIRVGSLIVGTYTGVVNDPGEPYTVAGWWERCVPDTTSCSLIDWDEDGNPARFENLRFPFTSSYRVQPVDIGYAFRYTLYALGDDTSQIRFSPTYAPTGVPPQPRADLTLGGMARDGETLAWAPTDVLGSPPIRTEYVWERCDVDGTSCSSLAPATTLRRTLIPADIGHRLRVSATSTNSVGSTSYSSPLSAVVAPIATANVAPPSIGGDARDGDQLHADPGVWRGSGPLTLAQVWQRCNAAGAACEPLDGSSATRRLGSDDIGHTMRLEVTASGLGGTVATTSAPTAVVAAVAPGSTSTPFVSGRTVEGETLQSDSGSWSGTGPLLFEHEWLSCEQTGESCTPIAGADAGDELTLTPALVGRTVRVRITATGPGGSHSARSAPTAPIAARPPLNILPPRIAPPAGGLLQPPAGATATAAVRVGGALEVGEDAWDGTGSLDYAVQWERCSAVVSNCRPIPNAQSRAYSPVVADVDHAVRARITATNIAGAAEAVTEPVLVLGDDVTALPATETPAAFPTLPAASRPLASAVLSLGQPRAHCVGSLRAHLGPGGRLRVRGSLAAGATILAGGRPVLRLVQRDGDLVARTAGGRVLALARDVGQVSWLRRTSERVSLRSTTGGVLLAVGAGSATVVVKGRTCRFRTAAAEPIAARADRAGRAWAYLTTDTGAPIAGAELRVTDRGRLRTIRTDARGRARLRLTTAAGGRAVAIAYAGDQAHAPVALTATLRVRATSTISGSARATRLLLRGRVTGEPRTVRVQYLDARRRWRQLGRASAGASGRWKLSVARPRAYAGATQVVLRTVLPARGAFLARVGGEVRVNLATRAR